MANNRIKKYFGALALGTVILAVPGCTDTWNDHYNTEEGGNATLSLWEQIKANPDLSKFATIAEKAKYWKDEKHAVNNYTYADVLKSGQINTVWAPENSYISDTEYQKWLDMCETDGYAVQQQFMGNHIALWRHNISDGGLDTLKMINGKNLLFDKSEATLQGVALNKKNMPALNGTLHTLKGVAPFNYNFYEYLKYSGELPEFGKYVVSKDTTYFSADNSIEGLPDENGNPTYVDSVYFTSNRLMQSKSYLPNSGAESWQMAEEGFGFHVEAEDSMVIMLMPTDEAWNKAYEKLKPYYKYATLYDDKVKGDKGSTTTIKGLDADSLQKMSIQMDMVSPLVFNVNKQPKLGGTTGILWTTDRFIETKGEEAEYLLNTFGDTLRSIEPDTLLGTSGWDKTSLFNGNVVKMSNGYGYEITDWAFPREFYKPDVNVELGYGVFYLTDKESYYKVGSGTKSQSFNNLTYADIADKYGKVTKNNFYLLMNPTASSNPHVEIKLKGNLNDAYVPNSEVMSGKYDVQVVLVPYWYKTIADAGEIDSVFYDSTYVDSISKVNMYEFKAQMRYNNGSKELLEKFKNPDTNKEMFFSAGNKVDTVTVATDFEFPYSYKNMRFSYPTLVIEGACSKTENKKGYIYPLCIDRVILKSKESDNVISLDPQE